MIDSKNLLQKLIGLGEKAEELDDRLRDVRIEVHNMLWDFVKLNIKKNKENKILFNSRINTDVNKNNGNC